MKDLQTQSKARCFQVQLAQTSAAVHFIADEQILTIEGANDLFQITRHRERTELRKILAPSTNAGGQSDHQRMHLPTARGRRHQFDP